MPRITATALIAIACCAAPRMIGPGGETLRQCLTPTIVAVAANVPRDLIGPIRDGAKSWGDAIAWGGATNIEIADGGEGFALIGLDDLGPTVCGLSTVRSDHRGCVTRATIRISRDCTYAPSLVRNIAAHEVGHALGLDHAGRGVMAPTVAP